MVWDFDGTVAVGHAPVRVYAREVEQRADDAAGLSLRVADFLADPHCCPELASAQDGYQAVALLARDRGISQRVLDAAYVASRALLGREPGDLTAPPGLVGLLNELDVTRVLVTNSPDTGLAAMLDHLGLTGSFDRIVTSANKPPSFGQLLADLLDEHGLGGRPGHLLSVGDIWANDLEPALALGCTTAYVDPMGRGAGPAHLRAATLPQLYPGIVGWADDPARFVEEHPLRLDAPVPTGTGSPTRPGSGD